MKTVFKKWIPDPLLIKLMQQKHLISLKMKKNHLWKAEKEKLSTLAKADPAPILFAGYQKSGNTWLRFLIFNYYNIIVNSAGRTLRYSELNEIYQNDTLGLPSNEIENKYPISGPVKDFPYLIRTHSFFKNQYRIFDKIIYISRNPLDVLVSKYNFYIKNRKKEESVSFPFNEIDSYVLFYLPIWRYHVKSYVNNDHIFHVTYEELKNDPAGRLEKILEYIGCKQIHKSAIDKSIEFSSFDSIKKMGRKSGETHGMAPKNSYHGEFTRKGKVGGFREELNPKTISQAKKIIKKYDTKFLKIPDDFLK